MIIEVLDKHYGGLTTIKEIIDWHGIRNVETNDDRILIRFRKKGNDMSRIKNGVLLKIFENDSYSMRCYSSFVLVERL